MRILVAAGALALTCSSAAVRPDSALAHEYKTAGLVIHHPWTRATPVGATAASGYVAIENDGTTPEKLIGGTFAAASGFEIHQMSISDGVMTMRPLEGGVEIAPGQTVKLEPGAIHLMFSGLSRQLKQAERVGGTLVFEKAGVVSVEFVVESIGAKGDDHAHTQ